MMGLEQQRELKELERDITTTIMAYLPGTIMLGLGLIAKLYPQSQDLHLLLNDNLVANSLLTTSIVVIGGCSYKYLNLTSEKLKKIS